eukprot:scpid111140/ scgid22844/ 
MQSWPLEPSMPIPKHYIMVFVALHHHICSITPWCLSMSTSSSIKFCNPCHFQATKISASLGCQTCRFGFDFTQHNYSSPRPVKWKVKSGTSLPKQYAHKSTFP